MHVTPYPPMSTTPGACVHVSSELYIHYQQDNHTTPGACVHSPLNFTHYQQGNYTVTMLNHNKSDGYLSYAHFPKLSGDQFILGFLFTAPFLLYKTTCCHPKVTLSSHPQAQTPAAPTVFTSHEWYTRPVPGCAVHIHGGSAA